MQLDLFLKEDEILDDNYIDISGIGIDFGNKNKSIELITETSKRINNLPEGKYLLYKTGASNPRYLDRSDFPYILNTEAQRIISVTQTRDFYPVVGLYKKKCKKLTVTIHRLVAMAYIPNPLPKDKTQVDHINGDTYDYSIGNLRWASQSENEIYKKQKTKEKRETHSQTRLNFPTTT